jgi:O-antigen ligase
MPSRRDSSAEGNAVVARRLLVLSLMVALFGTIPFVPFAFSVGLVQPGSRAAFLGLGVLLLYCAARLSGASMTAPLRLFPPVLAVFLMWCAMTIAWSVDREASALRIIESALTLGYLQIAVFVAAGLCRSPRDVAGVVAQSVFGAVIAGLLLNTVLFGTPIHFWVNPDVPDRPRLTFGHLHPLAAGDTLAIGLLAVTVSNWRLMFKAIVFVAMFALLLLTDSTGARLAVVGLAGLWALFTGQHPLRLPIRVTVLSLTAASLLLVVFLSPQLAGPLSEALAPDSRQVTLTGRVQIWSAILDNGLASTPLGYGFDAGPTVIGPLMGRAYHAHNQYLNILVELGAIGFLLFLMVIGALVYRMVRFGTAFPVMLGAYTLLLGFNNPGMFTKLPNMLAFMLALLLPVLFPRRRQQQERQAGRFRSAPWYRHRDISSAPAP